jgi:hypothetical protein
MDAGLTVKPIGSAQASHARSGSQPGRTAVLTELAPARAVTAAGGATDAAGHDLARNPPSPLQTSREVLIDPQTREVIFRVIATRTGRLISQVPEEAMLKLEAYNRVELKRKTEGKAVERTI